jgi:hypothetical protein
MTNKLSSIAMVTALFLAPVAWAEGKKKCEATCDDFNAACEEQMLKKMGDDEKDKKKLEAMKGQAKKMCADTAKRCRSECK